MREKTTDERRQLLNRHIDYSSFWKVGSATPKAQTLREGSRRRRDTFVAVRS
jgi:hypothetical protein